MTDVASVRPEVAGQAVVEGLLLARYRYHALKQASATALADVSLVTTARRHDAVARGAERGRVMAAAAKLARDLANTPPAYLTASRMTEVAAALAADRARPSAAARDKGRAP